MPLNSPPHYVPYNGGMECAVRELKTPPVEKILAGGPTSEFQVQAWAEVLAHELNHRSRGCLDGHIACRVFQDAKPALQAYTLRTRREMDQRTHRGAYPGLGGSHATPSRNRLTSGGWFESTQERGITWLEKFLISVEMS